jgi:hypothetical protein
MGHSITYCGQCGIQLRDADFEKQSAFQLGEKVYCKKCAPDEIKSLASAKKAATPAASASGTQPKASSTHRIPIATPAAHGGSGETRSRMLLIWGGATACLIAVIAIAFLSGRGEPRAPAPRDVAPSPPPPTVNTPDRRREEEAFRALKGALDFERANPDDPAAQLARFEEAARACQGTSLLAEARRKIESIERTRRERQASALAELDGTIATAIDREEFKRSRELLEAARKRRPEPEWSTAIELRLRKIDESARALFVSVKESALDARKQGKEEAVQKELGRVLGWGLQDLKAELETALLAVPPPPAPAPVRPYDLKWRKALAHASGRDFSAAIRELEDATAQAEGAADLEALKQAAAFHAEALKVLAAWPKGEKVSLKYRDEQETLREIEGTLLRADERRIEVREGKATVAVETGEISAGSLVQAWKERGKRSAPTESRGAVLLCLLERDVEGARRWQGEMSTPVLPEKYWAQSGPVADRREKEARKLFFGALRDFQDPRIRIDCAQKCRRLLAEYSDTALVRRNQKSIVDRSDAGRDYFFAAVDLAAAGAFKPSSHSAVGPCWTSAEDVTGLRSKENYIEVAFSALPDTEYRCWVQVGACCAETFAFYLQATDLAIPHPKDAKQTVQAEPGETFALPVRHEIRNLRASHSAHGGAKEPKRWEWVALRLPKYATGGLKKIRLLSEQKGFSVAAAVISSTRRAPPTEAELKEELERIGPRLTELAAAGPAAARPGKVLYSETFDRGSSRFSGGEIVEGGAGGSKALSMPPDGTGMFGAYTATVGASTVLRMKLKPLGDARDIQIMIWSEKQKENYRYFVPALKPDEWKDIEFKAVEMRFGFAKDGPSLEGDVISSLKIFYKGSADSRLLLDDVEVRE